MGFPVSEERIEAAERELGTRFVSEHRARLARNNGGEIACDDDVWQLHPVWDDSDRTRAARTTSHIVHETREARAWDNFPEDGVAIATNGDELLVFRRESRLIERWHHEDDEGVPVEIDWDSE